MLMYHFLNRLRDANWISSVDVVPSSGQDDEMKRKILIKLHLEMQKLERGISESSQCKLQHDELIIFSPKLPADQKKSQKILMSSHCCFANVPSAYATIIGPVNQDYYM